MKVGYGSETLPKKWIGNTGSRVNIRCQESQDRNFFSTYGKVQQMSVANSDHPVAKNLSIVTQF
jgi:hypothetical protein